MHLSTSAFQRFYRAAHLRLKEDFEAITADTISRETERLMQIEGNKILAQATLIINSNATVPGKIEALRDLLFPYDDEDDDDDEHGPTEVDTHPNARG